MYDNYVNNYEIYTNYLFKPVFYVGLTSWTACTGKEHLFSSFLKNFAPAKVLLQTEVENLEIKCEKEKQRALSFAKIHTFMVNNKLDRKVARNTNSVCTGEFLLAKTSYNISLLPRTDRSDLISHTVSLQNTA